MSLSKGSSGDSVRHLQESLNKLGFGLNVDGHFGDKTHNAVITMQTLFGYDQDGIAGPATVKLIETQGGYGWHVEAARKAFRTGGAA